LLKKFTLISGIEKHIFLAIFSSGIDFCLQIDPFSQQTKLFVLSHLKQTSRKKNGRRENLKRKGSSKRKFPPLPLYYLLEYIVTLLLVGLIEMENLAKSGKISLS